MKTIIAGSRTIADMQTVEDAIAGASWTISEVVSGTARGVDSLGERWAMFNNIPVCRFPADWDRYGKSAGYIRNGQMANYADALIAVWDGRSRGTHSMIKLATERGILVSIFRTDIVWVKELPERYQ